MQAGNKNQALKVWNYINKEDRYHLKGYQYTSSILVQYTQLL